VNELPFHAKSLLVVVLCLVVQGRSAADDKREAKIAKDKATFQTKADWLYNDLEGAYATAKETGKPIMAVLRCIPCEECVKLDDDLIDNDPIIASLTKEFVRLRLTSTTGSDPTTCQDDTDQ